MIIIDILTDHQTAEAIGSALARRHNTVSDPIVDRDIYLASVTESVIRLSYDDRNPVPGRRDNFLNIVARILNDLIGNGHTVGVISYQDTNGRAQGDRVIYDSPNDFISRNL